MNRAFPHKPDPSLTKRRLFPFAGFLSGWLLLCVSTAWAETPLQQSDQPRLRFVTPTVQDDSPVPSPTGRPDSRPGFATSGQSENTDASPAYSPMRLTPAVPGGVPAPQRTETFRPLLPRPLLRRNQVRENELQAAPAPPAPQAPTFTTVPRPPRHEPSEFTGPLRETAPEQPIDREELNRVLQNGIALESEARWRDVLNHYETALRIFRNDESVMERYRVARFHYDIGLRYHDTSYLNFVRSLSFVDALRFYEKVVQTIQAEYYDLPHWDRLFRHGIKDLEIALSDPAFLRQTGVNDPRQAGRYIETMRKTADGWEIRNRDDMRNGILRLAEIAQEQLGLNPAVTLTEYTCGMVNSLDHYTSYLTPNLLNDQMSIISGNLVGLGVELGSDRDSLMILRVIQGSPAETGGLKDGDRILAVDGVTTRGKDTDEAANLLQGEEGSVVRLQILSTGFAQKPREVRIVRRQIEVPSVENVRMLNNYLGYIKLTGFQSKTCDEMKRALAELDRQGMRCLVLDMRKNPGGLFLLGVEVASLFIDQGAIVRTKGRNSNIDVPYLATKGETWNMPLIVLIDEETASAAEIVAGAIRDHDRGVIIGRRSYGKGTIQKIFPQISENTPGQGGLRLTVEKFYSPKGWPYSEVGVSPDVVVDVEKRWSLAKLVDGKLQIPLQSRTVTSDMNDPFIRQAMKTAETIMHPSTAQRN